VAIPWYIMTSPANHEQTLDYLRKERFFGLPERDVILFRQGMLPQFSLDGHALMNSKHSLALGPDGHGGSLKALAHSGALQDMKSRGVSIISYFQVDNPLVKPLDPLFIGWHAETGSEMSVKVTPKADDLERVGNVCLADGKVSVIEYSELPEELAHARTESGRRKFDAANLAIHLIDVAFVERIVGTSFRLPFRRAVKAVPYMDSSGEIVEPEKPNAVKLETFVFDAFPHARHALVFEVDRAEEFSPVKNATGVDSLETSQRDQIRRACRWIEGAGVPVPRRPDGEPDVTVVVSPRFALDETDLRHHRSEIPELHPGDRLLLG
jgi:UDP-N-acetylglucosamine/UDP-N-acetylgalactosamine diphosphorylase